MYSWQNLRAEILRQEILELEEQPEPEDQAARRHRRHCLMKKQQELISVESEETRSGKSLFQDLQARFRHNPEDITMEEILKAANDLEKMVDRQEDFVEKSGKILRARMQRSWHRASIPQRGDIAARFAVYNLKRGARRIMFHSLHFSLKAMRYAARKRG